MELPVALAVTIHAAPLFLLLLVAFLAVVAVDNLNQTFVAPDHRLLVLAEVGLFACFGPETLALSHQPMLAHAVNTVVCRL